MATSEFSSAASEWPTLFYWQGFTSYYGYCMDADVCDELLQLFSYETSTSYVVKRSSKDFGHFSLTGMIRP